MFDSCKMFPEVYFITKKRDWDEDLETSLTMDLEEIDIEILMLS